MTSQVGEILLQKEMIVVSNFQFKTLAIMYMSLI